MSFLVETTETVELLVFVTNSAPLATCSEVGCRPTSIEPTAAVGRVVSITLMVPVVDVPRNVSATTSVPYEVIVVSPAFARRPPSFDT